MGVAGTSVVLSALGMPGSKEWMLVVRAYARKAGMLRNSESGRCSLAIS